jgi:hypothetical protein
MLTEEQKKINNRIAVKKYRQSAKGKANRYKYRHSPEYKAIPYSAKALETKKRYRQSEAFKARPQSERSKMTQKRYKQTEKSLKSCKDWQLKTAYGITLIQYNEMLTKQNNVCYICHKPETVVKYGKVQNLAVDHNHVTNRVRGLLCTCCNRGLGLFKNNIDSLLRAVDYIKEDTHAST